MHKKHAALLLLTASLASCTGSEKEGPIYGKGLSFIATNGDSSPDSKSYFGPGGETLYWSAYDNLGVYNYTSPLSSPTGKVCGAVCNLISRNGSSATFSDRGLGTWTSTSAANYCFYAYYPEQGSLKAESGGIVEGLSVPEIQDKHFGNYHICCTQAPAIVSASDLESSKAISLNFNPVTSLISICPILDASSPLEEIRLSEVTVTFENAPVTGNCRLNLADGSLELVSNEKNTVTAKLLNQDIVVKKQRSARIDLVVLPVRNYSGAVTFAFRAADSSVELGSVTKTVSGKRFDAGKRYSLEVSGITASVMPASESANCYLVNANCNSAIMIPVRQGLDGWTAIDNFNALRGVTTNYAGEFSSAIWNDYSAKLVWSDNPDLKVSGAKVETSGAKYLQLVFGNAVNGSNAVVAMVEPGGKVLWSWHIWFTDYNPDNIIDRNAGVVENGLVHHYGGSMWNGGIYEGKYMMDRNLGARLTSFTSAVYPTASNLSDYFGLYYQYGRKDPFPTAGAVSTASGPVSIAESARNPGVFYTNANNEDWNLNSDVILDLWAGKSDTVLEKSALDPCPAGWRVPICYLSDDWGTVRLNTWSDFSAEMFKARSGYFLYKGTDSNGDGSNNTVYPLAGRLSRGSGTPYVQNTEGCYWSASPQASYAAAAKDNARYFLFKSGTHGGSVNGDATARSNALSVRCVQDGVYAPVTPHWELNREKSDDFYTWNPDKWLTSSWVSDTYCNYSSSNVKVEDGLLKISARKESSGGKNYSAGVVKSRFTVGANTAVEFRAKMTPHAAHLRNALWLSDTPVAEKNPNMEIDLLETWASDSWPDWKFSSGILYWWIGDDKPSWYKESANGMMPVGLLYYRQDHSSTRTEKWLSEAFHTFRVERSGASVRFYIDGKLYWERACNRETWASGQTAPSTDDQGSNNMLDEANFTQVLEQERCVLMSLHSVGSAPIDSYLPCEFEIDYVHVYDYVQ